MTILSKVTSGVCCKDTNYHKFKMDQTASPLLTRFVRRCKRRLYSIQNEAYANNSCGKLVTAIKYGKLQTWRCHGDISDGSCYNCSSSSCRTCHCGNALKQDGGAFCSSSCHGIYYSH